MSKKLALAGLILLCVAAVAMAEPKHTYNRTTMKDAGTFVSQSVYFASATNTPGTLVISSVAAYLESISVSSGGAPGSFFEVFDSSSGIVVSSQTDQGTMSNPRTRRISFAYPASGADNWPMNQGCLYGITLNVSTPAASVWGQYPRLQINYYER